MSRDLILWLSLALLLVASAAAYAQKEGKAGPEKHPAAPFDGVWEQFEVRIAKGKVTYWPKIVIFNRGRESHWATTQGRGSLVKPQKLTMGEKDAFEFVNQNDNLTIRGLYEFSDRGVLKMCWRDDNRTLIRPEQMTPLPEECAYHVFRRLTFETKSATECDKELAGLWYMTAMAEDGEFFEKKDFDYSFEKREIALYVEGDHVLLLKPQNTQPYLQLIHARMQFLAKAKERAADIKFPDGCVAQAIYAVTKDRLSICWVKNGKRPDEFSANEGDGRTVYWLKRAAMPK